jgi:hypothetical protein
MKRCPSCSRTYEDDALSFCLTDGSPLVKDESAAGSIDQLSTATPPVADWSAPPAQAVSTDAPMWGSVGMPPQQPAPSWSGGYPQVPPPPPFPQSKEQGLAIASLVCGVLSFLCCSVFTGIPAIVLGLMALNKEKSDPNRYGGKGMAIGGIILGALSVVLLAIYGILMLAGAFPMS